MENFSQTTFEQVGKQRTSIKSRTHIVNIITIYRLTVVYLDKH